MLVFSSIWYARSLVRYGPPSLDTSRRFGVGTFMESRILSTRRRSQRIFCIRRSLTQYGRRRVTYEMALSSGKPDEKNEIKKSLLDEKETYPHAMGEKQVVS